MAEAVTPNNLLVIDMPHANVVKLDDWGWKRDHFFAGENCDRNLLIGTVEDLAVVPEAVKQVAVRDASQYNDENVLMLEGHAAYNHMLRAACGMLDKQIGEKKTIEEIRVNWNAFTQPEQGQPHKPRTEKFGKIVEALFTDVKAIRARAFEDRDAGYFLKAVSTQPAVAARNLIRPSGKNNALIICEKDGITESTFKVLDNYAGMLGITHPDPGVCEKYANAFRKMEYKANIEIIPYEELFSPRLNEFNVVFNCQPMDNGANDKRLIDAWREHGSPQAQLVHLKGNPFQRDTTSALWTEAKLPNVHFIEDVNRQRDRDKAHNQDMLRKAELAIENCGVSRQLGRRPVDSINKDTGVTHLFDFPPAYEAFVRAAAGKADKFKKPPVESAPANLTRRDPTNWTHYL